MQRCKFFHDYSFILFTHYMWVVTSTFESQVTWSFWMTRVPTSHNFSYNFETVSEPEWRVRPSTLKVAGVNNPIVTYIFYISDFLYRWPKFMSISWPPHYKLMGEIQWFVFSQMLVVIANFTMDDIIQDYHAQDHDYIDAHFAMEQPWGHMTLWNVTKSLCLLIVSYRKEVHTVVRHGLIVFSSSRHIESRKIHMLTCRSRYSQISQFATLPMTGNLSQDDGAHGLIVFSSSRHIESRKIHMLTCRSRYSQISQFATLPMTGNLSQDDETFKKWQAPGYSHFVHLRFYVQLTWGQVSHVTSPIISLWGILNLLYLQHK